MSTQTAAMGAINSPLESLRGQPTISLTTFRKNGDPVSTPVIFCEMDGKIYIVTGKTTGKLKRLVNNPEVQIAPCKMDGIVTGASVKGRVRMLSEAEQASIRQRVKFPVPAPMMFIFNLSRTLRQGGNVYLEISV